MLQNTTGKNIINRLYVATELNIQRDKGSTQTLLQDRVNKSQLHQSIMAKSNNMPTIGPSGLNHRMSLCSNLHVLITVSLVICEQIVT